MSTLGISEAFARYGATLRNPQWSVSAWTPDDLLVVSLWDHHYRKGSPGTMEFVGSTNRWSGHGNVEFTKNVTKAFSLKSKVKLVIVRTDEIGRVEAGEDASSIKKDFHLRDDLIGQVTEFDGENYVFIFRRE